MCQSGKGRQILKKQKVKKNLANGIGSTCSKWPIIGHHIQSKKEKRRASAPSWWQHSPYPLFLRCISFGRWGRDVSPPSQSTRSYTPSRQQSTCLLFTACIWTHTCQGIQPGISVNNSPHSKKHGEQVTSGARWYCQDSWHFFPNCAPLFLLSSDSRWSSSCCPTDTHSSKHKNYVSVHRQKGCFSHKQLSFKTEERLSQRALVDSSFLSLDQWDHMTGKETQATVIDLSPIMIHPLEMGLWSFPLQHKF